MIKFLLRPILLGLVTALILLIAVPSLRPNIRPTQLSLMDNLSSTPLSFNQAVRLAAPAVTNIYSQQYIDGDRLKLKTQGLGSGVIVSPEGYIITNYHVVAQADQIVVALQDGRVSSTAQIIGLDKRTDIAVLKINLPNLPVIPQNEDYQAQVGDVVLAIGNPYNLGQTTTLGIISATGRSAISSDGHQAFIQTDAAINEGNSGGALVNTRGELVGINTASFQQATDLETYGISFAIPYELAHEVMQRIIADGRVIRGYIGIEGQDVNPVAARLLGIENIDGIIITNIIPDSPAEKAGLKTQDIIAKVDDNPIHNSQSVIEMVTELRPGTTVNVDIIRNGKLITLPILIEEDPRD